MAKQLKKWQGWALFGGSMIVVFLLGLLRIQQQTHRV